MTSFVIYYSADARKNEIYLLIIGYANNKTCDITLHDVLASFTEK